MDSIRQFYAGVQELDRKKIISISWLKTWIVSLFVVFIVFNYVWSSIFSNMRDTHIPFALLSPADQLKEMRLYHRSNNEIKKSQINKINFVIFACNSGSQSYSDGKDKVNVTTEAVRTMKSVTLFTQKIIHFHIFTEDTLYPAFVSEVDHWPNHILHRVTFEFHAANYPEAIFDEDTNVDEATRKACDMSFLFIPSIVKDLDFAIYARSGVVFLSSIDELWMRFREYNDHNSLALPLKVHNGQCQHKDDIIQKHVSYVYDISLIEYDILQLHTGIFKVPVLRKAKFKNNPLFPLNVEEFETVEMTWNPTMLLAIYKFFKPYFTSPLTDLINIVALFNPNKIYSLPCEWNYDVTLSQSKEHLCPNAKLVLDRRNANSCTTDANFELIFETIDNFDFQKTNLSSIKKSLKKMRNQMIVDFSTHSYCSTNSFYSTLK